MNLLVVLIIISYLIVAFLVGRLVTCLEKDEYSEGQHGLSGAEAAIIGLLWPGLVCFVACAGFLFALGWIIELGTNQKKEIR